MIAKEGRVRSEKEKLLMDMENSVVIAGRRVEGGGERGFKGDKW